MQSAAERQESTDDHDDHEKGRHSNQRSWWLWLRCYGGLFDILSSHDFLQYFYVRQFCRLNSNELRIPGWPSLDLDLSVANPLFVREMRTYQRRGIDTLYIASRIGAQVCP